MKYTIQIWLFTIMASPLLIALILGIIINESGFNEILDSYQIIFLMILFGLFLSIPAMVFFWYILRNLDSNILVWKKKIILTVYSFLSVWITFYIFDNGFVIRWSDQTIWVLIYSLTISIGVWIFKFPRRKIIK